MRHLCVLVVACAACGAPDPTLSTTAQEAVVVGPSSRNFGSVTIGQTSAPISFTVSPAGSGESNDTVVAVVGCPSFTINAPNLPAQVFRHCQETQEPTNPNEIESAMLEQAACGSPNIRTYPFSATFSPTAAGPHTCNGVVQLASGTQAFSMTGVGALPDFDIDVSPKSINFRDIDVGVESNPRKVTVRNLGAQKLRVSAALTGDTTELKVTGNTAPHDLGSGDAEDFAITCTPTAPLVYAGRLRISSDDPTSRETDVDLACNGILSSLEITPNTFDVSTLVGAPRTVTVTIKNDGNVDGVVKAVELESPVDPRLAMVSASFAGDTLAVGEERVVQVRFTPDGPADEAELGNLVVEFDNDAPRRIPIAGGVKTARVGTEPNLLDFGPVCAGVQTDGERVDVYAAADGEFQVLGATATAPFAVPANEQTLPAAFTAGPPGTNRQRFNLSVTAPPPPPGEITAEVTGTLTVQTTSPGEESFAVPLKATALAEGITALPAELHLGATQVATLTSAQTVTFTNCSTAPVMLMAQTIGGPHASDFVLTREFQPLTVMPAETIGIDVLFTPKAAGPRQASLAIEFTGGSTTVDLAGDGIGVPVFRDTYYACSSGGDATGWLVFGGVIAIVVRRRRRV